MRSGLRRIEHVHNTPKTHSRNYANVYGGVHARKECGVEEGVVFPQRDVKACANNSCKSGDAKGTAIFMEICYFKRVDENGGVLRVKCLGAGGGWLAKDRTS